MPADDWGIARDARVTWHGGLTDGLGRVEGGAGEATGATLTWPGRTAPTGPPDDAATSPEQLIAAAHAGCYSMSLAAVLDAAGRPPTELDVRARCRARLSADGLRIEAIEIAVDARCRASTRRDCSGPPRWPSASAPCRPRCGATWRSSSRPGSSDAAG
jgi:osmotically inducible protein OsmC